MNKKGTITITTKMISGIIMIIVIIVVGSYLSSIKETASGSFSNVCCCKKTDMTNCELRIKMTCESDQDSLISDLTKCPKEEKEVKK